MLAAGQAYRRAGVGAIYLVHGTFVGQDAVGLISELGRVFPSVGDTLRRLARQMADKAFDEAGNYSSKFVDDFDHAINAGSDLRVPVQSFEWSSENNHIGRADGAVRLIYELAELDIPSGKRVLLWGHSHAGNVFALVSQLLGGDKSAVSEFFDAARMYYKWPVLGFTDIPMWRAISKMLKRRQRPFADRPLDFVTFGTPIRYGWNSAGYGRLLHFVYHRPALGLPEYQAPFPPTPERVLKAADGDYVQQLGIAGTNFGPSLFSWRARWAESRLGDLLQREVSDTSLIDRFRAGTRVSESGTTLLVDYGQPSGTIAQHHAGHALYTKREWLLFHAEEVARRLYA